MQYLARFHDGDELRRVRALLRSKGIPTHEQEVETRKMGEQWALYACLAEQAEDALLIMRNPKHEPAVRVAVEPFEKALANPDTGLLTRWITICALVVLPAVAAVFYVVWRFG